MGHFHIRKISKRGTIRLLGKEWRPSRGDAKHLWGFFMAFADYMPNEPKLLNLWGTASSYYDISLDETPLQKELWKRDCELLGVKQGGGGHPGGSGSYLVDGDVFYKSRGIDFWKPIERI